MSGAYTAKPGLNYTLVMTMATSFLAGDALPVIGSFRLDGTRRTIEPPDPTITWTATVDDVAVNLRIAGVGSYVSSVTSEAADSGVYWQSSVSLEFEDIGAAADQVLIVTGSATMVETAISDSKAAAVPDYSLVVTGPATMIYDTSAICTASFRADTTDKTVEPSNKTITWSSKVDGSPVDLRIGIGSFASTVEDTVVDGSFWEVTSNLKFDLSRAFIDRTLVVTGAGVIDGLAVNDTASMTIEGWFDLQFTFDGNFSDLTFQGGGGNTFRGKLDLELWVIDLPSTTDWYKKIEYARNNDGSYSVTTISETGSDPGNVIVTDTTTYDITDPFAKFGTIDLTVDVGQQVTNKKYRIKVTATLGTNFNRWSAIYVHATRNSIGSVAQTATNTSITHNLPGSVQTDTTGESFTVTEIGTMWPS